MHALSAYLNGVGSNLRGRPLRDQGESLRILDVLMRNASSVRGGQKSDRDSPGSREAHRKLRSR